MGKIFVNQLPKFAEENTPFISFFQLEDVQLKEARNGSSYLMLRLSDKTGTVTAFMWDHFAEVLTQLEPNTIAKVQGEMNVYKGKMSVAIQKIRPATDADRTEDHFSDDDFQIRNADAERVVDKLFALIDSIQTPLWKSLLTAFFHDPLFREQFFRAPGAKYMHHNFYGGLAEHTVNVASLAQHLGAFYHLDVDLLITAALLHDIGKIKEYTQKGFLETTTEGHLLGHITLTDEMVTEKAKALPEYSRIELMRLRHLLLSHHGLLEYGSPRLPQTPEAFLLHYVDNVDAKMDCLRNQMETARKENKEWPYVKALNQVIWAGSPLPEERDL